MDTRETITLDGPAQRRLTILTHLLAGELTLDETAVLLELSTRQVRRLVERFRRDGAAALIHGNRGRRPVNRLDDERRARLLELAATTYAGFNATHLAEMLAEEEPGLAVSAKTLLRLLVVEDSIITDNHSGNGGGISNAGTARVSGSKVMRNSADFQGGGIYNTGAITLTKTKVQNNTLNDCFGS
jgi:predicted outer membrane repeat protein